MRQHAIFTFSVANEGPTSPKRAVRTCLDAAQRQSTRAPESRALHRKSPALERTHFSGLASAASTSSLSALLALGSGTWI